MAEADDVQILIVGTLGKDMATASLYHASSPQMESHVKVYHSDKGIGI